MKLNNYIHFVILVILLPNNAWGEGNQNYNLGTIIISSSPISATVFVDGNYCGKTPLTIENLEAKSHQVLIFKKGYKSEENTIQLMPNTVKEIKSKLEPHMWKKKLQSIKIGADITTTKGPVPLSHILQRLVDMKGMNLRSEDNVKLDTPVNVKIRVEDSLDDALLSILSQTGYDFEFIDADNLIFITASSKRKINGTSIGRKQSSKTKIENKQTITNNKNVSQTKIPPEATLYFDSGVFWLERRNLKKAYGYLSEAIKIYPEYTEAKTKLEKTAILINEQEKFDAEQERLMKIKREKQKALEMEQAARAKEQAEIARQKDEKRREINKQYGCFETRNTYKQFLLTAKSSPRASDPKLNLVLDISLKKLNYEGELFTTVYSVLHQDAGNFDMFIMRIDQFLGADFAQRCIEEVISNSCNSYINYEITENNGVINYRGKCE